MKRSETIGEFSKALTSFQKSAPKIKKDKTARIPTKKGGEYSYKYADLASIWDAIRGSLADNKLSVMQSPHNYNGEQGMTTVIMHESGEWVEETMKLIVVEDSPQGQGSAITYARRYMLSAMLGIVADEDNDAANHRTISAIEKKKLWDVAKTTFPDITNPYDLTKQMAEIFGKHPNRILSQELDEAIEAMEMYQGE